MGSTGSTAITPPVYTESGWLRVSARIHCPGAAIAAVSPIYEEEFLGFSIWISSGGCASRRIFLSADSGRWLRTRIAGIKKPAISLR